MFSKLVMQNAKKSRNENLIYFGTLVTAVVSFYIILSLENQSVIQYLKDFESDAVNKLFALMPILYGFALFLIFFLVLFANRYQLERRSKEFGLYMLMGMQPKNLFSLLFAESLFTSALALLLGLGGGVLLSEALSLTTSRLIGQGIIGHELSFSIQACIYTVLGFLFIQFLALMVLSKNLFHQELQTLLIGKVEEKQALGNEKNNWLTFLAGAFSLVVAYILIIRYFKWMNILMIGLAIILGIFGTYFVIRGLARILNGLALRKAGTQGLATFTIRQLQENITNHATAVTVASLLMMFSVVLLAEGASTILSSNQNLERESAVYDFTVVGEDVAIEAFLTSSEMAPYVDDLNPLEIGRYDSDLDFAWEGLRRDIVAHLPEGMSDPTISNVELYTTGPDQSEAENLLNRLAPRLRDFIIPASSYNRLLETADADVIELANNEVAVYYNPEFVVTAEDELLNDIFTEANAAKEPLLEIAGEPIHIVPDLTMKGLVVDRSITITVALVVSDVLYEEITSPSNRGIYWNFVLPPELKEAEGLMEPMKEASDLLASAGFQYESYLHNFGRHLFYVIAGSYTMLYLSFIFLIVGCTVLALQFLTQFKQTKRRYQTLSFLGAKQTQMVQSLKKQVRWYFLFPLIPALISGVIGIIAMNGYINFNVGFLPGNAQMLPFVLLMIFVFILVQWVYARAVFKAAYREIKQQEFK